MDSGRLIIIGGVAHSGTTILAYVLRQHPSIRCIANGNEAWILENDYLPNERGDLIEKELGRYPHKRLLMKRPWNFVWHSDWMRTEISNAYFLYCSRDFEGISASWSKPTSLVDDRFRNGGVEVQKQHYDFCTERSESFGKTMQNFMKIDHKEFVNNPKTMIQNINAWLGLPNFDYNVSQVSFEKNIKDILYARIR